MQTAEVSGSMWGIPQQQSLSARDQNLAWIFWVCYALCGYEVASIILLGKGWEVGRKLSRILGCWMFGVHSYRRLAKPLRGLAEDRYQRVWRTLESLLQGQIGHLQNYSMSTVDTRSSPTEIRRWLSHPFRWAPGDWNSRAAGGRSTIPLLRPVRRSFLVWKTVCMLDTGSCLRDSYRICWIEKTRCSRKSLSMLAFARDHFDAP